MVRLTDRGKALLVAGLLLWVASRLFGIAELAMAAVACGALVLLAVGFTGLTSARLTSRRSLHPSRLFADAEGQVTVELANAGRVPTAILEVEDRSPSTLVDGGRATLPPLPPGRRTSVTYRVHGRQRGRFTIGPLEVHLRDPFGVARRLQAFTSTDELIVYPPVWRLAETVPLGGHQGSGGEGRPRPITTGEELSNVREYVRGDDLRKVHWRSTAHRGKLMVRQDEAPQDPSATLVLDRRAAAHAGTGPASSFEVAVSAAASVTYHLAERSLAVQLLTEPATTSPRAIPWELALERLATIDVSSRMDLGALYQQLGQGVASSGVLVAVVAVPDPAMLRAMVRAGRGYPSRIALLIDSRSFGASRRDPSPASSTPDALRAAGWHVTIVGRGDRLDQRWRELIAHGRGARSTP